MTLFIFSLSSCYLGHYGAIRASSTAEAKALLAERLREAGVDVNGVDQVRMIEIEQKKAEL